MRSVVRALALVVLCAPLAGCVATDTSELFREQVEITADNLDALPLAGAKAALRGEKTVIDVEVEGYSADTAPLLDALVSGLEKDEGLQVGRVVYRGELAWRPNALRSFREAPALAAEQRLRLSCEPRFHASAWNGLIAFPGMIAFAPIWKGYGWELALDVTWTLEGGPTTTRHIEVAFREKNARRSAIFHIWPSTGFLGTQFVAGLILAPTFWFYDADTTPLLVQALEPRLGATIASAVRRDVEAAGCPRRLAAAHSATWTSHVGSPSE